MAGAERVQNSNDDRIVVRRSVDLTEIGPERMQGWGPLGDNGSVRQALDYSINQSVDGVATPLASDIRSVVNLGVSEQSVGPLDMVERPETRMKKIGRKTKEFMDNWGVVLGVLGMAGYAYSSAKYYSHDTCDSPADDSSWKGSLGGMLVSAAVIGVAIGYPYARSRYLRNSLAKIERENVVPLQVFPQASVNNV